MMSEEEARLYSTPYRSLVERRAAEVRDLDAALFVIAQLKRENAWLRGLLDQLQPPVSSPTPPLVVSTFPKNALRHSR
jgi:hypothetical protein